MKNKIVLIVMLLPIFTSNGMYFRNTTELLNIIAQYMPAHPIILEAGGYEGQDTYLLACKFQDAKIYTFEPIPALYRILYQRKLQIPQRIFAYQLALGDFVGEAEMYVSEDSARPHLPSQSSSLLPPKEHIVVNHDVTFNKKIKVPVTTIDAWAKSAGVDHIDFMWLDMQGYELNTLKASPRILKTVKMILTEVEFIEAYEGQYQYQVVKTWLEEQGFTMVAQNFNAIDWFGDALFVRL